MRCQPIVWSSRKSQKVTRSVSGSRTVAFADASDTTRLIEHDLEEMSESRLSIAMITDCLSLFDVITHASKTVEKWLMIDLGNAKNAYRRKKLSTVGFVRDDLSPSDAQTKHEKCPSLTQMLSAKKTEHSFEHWVKQNWASRARKVRSIKNRPRRFFW